MLKFLSGILGGIIFLFGYIKSERLYPEPLSKTEEEMYLRKYFSGDKEAKKILIEHNLRLVVHIAKKYSKDEQELEEYTSIGTIGLIKAINSFKEEKGYKISTYASKCIDNEILMSIRTNKKTLSDVSMNLVIGTDKDGNDMELADTLAYAEKDPADEIDEEITKNKINEYIDKKLPPRESKIMKMRYGLEGENVKTQEEVASIMNISRSYVSRIETKVSKLIREYINQK